MKIGVYRLCLPPGPVGVSFRKRERGLKIQCCSKYEVVAILSIGQRVGTDDEHEKLAETCCLDGKDCQLFKYFFLQQSSGWSGGMAQHCDIQ